MFLFAFSVSIIYIFLYTMNTWGYFWHMENIITEDRKSIQTSKPIFISWLRTIMVWESSQNLITNQKGL